MKKEVVLLVMSLIAMLVISVFAIEPIMDTKPQIMLSNPLTNVKGVGNVQ